jgi:hypothetical protein
MAQELKDTDLTATQGPGRHSNYPWAEWTNGSVWECRQGEDFKTSVQSFKSVLRYQARQRGIRVVTQIDGLSKIRFQFLDGAS